jgi:tRNA(Ile)-lysidine synthase
MHQLAAGRGLSLAVAHYDHGLRPESGADAAWTEQLAEKLHTPIRIGRAARCADDSPPRLAGWEARARRERYKFLAVAARDLDCAWVATGHTADDQAETVLHHIIRGTGLAGLRGIAELRRLSAGARLVRPCLHVRRDELRAALQERGQDFRQDATNDDLRLTRNALRQLWLPRLRSGLNPRVDQALCRLAEQAQDACRILRQRAVRLLTRAIVEQGAEHVRLTSRVLSNAPSERVREAAVQLWRQQGWPRGRMTFAQWQAAAELLSGRGPARIDWPDGVSGLRRGANVLLMRKPPPPGDPGRRRPTD